MSEQISIEIVAPLEPLSTKEEIRLYHLEVSIKKGIEDADRAVLLIWRSFAAIRDERLYKATHSTFEAYCQEKWHKDRHWVHRLIQAGELNDRLEMLSGDNKKLNEWQSRQLEGLSADQQVEAAKGAQAIAPNPTAKDYRAAANATKTLAPDLVPGAVVTIRNEAEDYNGQSGVIEQRSGVAVQVRLEDGSKIWELTSRLSLANQGQAQSAPTPAQPPRSTVPNPIDRLEALESENRILKLRIRLLSDLLRAGVAIVRSGELSEDGAQWCERVEAKL